MGKVYSTLTLLPATSKRETPSLDAHQFPSGLRSVNIINHETVCQPTLRGRRRHGRVSRWVHVLSRGGCRQRGVPPGQHGAQVSKQNASCTVRTKCLKLSVLFFCRYDWNEADQFCRAQDAHLVEITTEDKFTFLQARVAEMSESDLI